MHLWLIWLLLGVLLATGEILTPGFVLGCFAIGCFATSVVAALDFSLTVQIATFSAITFLIFVSARPVLVDWLGKRNHAVKTNVERLIGMKGVVLNEVSQFSGAVKIGGEVWSGRTADERTVMPGALVRILRVEGNKVIVTPAEHNNNHQPSHEQHSN